MQITLPATRTVQYGLAIYQAFHAIWQDSQGTSFNLPAY
jgi:hypothetical protein